MAAETASNTHARRGALHYAIVGAALTALAFEQSPANEALRAKIAFDVLEASSSAVLVGLVVLGLTFVIEMVPSVLISLGLARSSGLVSRVRGWLKRHDATDTPVARFSLTDLGIALGIGAGFVVAKHHLRQARPRLRDDMGVGAAASLVVAVFSGIIGWLVAGGITHAETVGLGTPAEWFVSWATDWRFWGAVLVA